MKLMTHLIVGYPTFADTIELAKILEKAGADMLELQIPFSDPIADGLTIMRASEDVLRQEFTLFQVFDLVKKVAQQVAVPVYIMAYYNTVFRLGVDKFCQLAKQARVKGLIIPDMPVEEESQEHLFSYCKKNRLENIRVIAPISTEERLRKNALVASGFVYAISHQGTTGARNVLELGNREFFERVKKSFSIPIAVGFGISNKEQINALKGYADIVIVGSAIIDVMNKTKKEDKLHAVADFIKGLKVVE